MKKKFNGISQSNSKTIEVLFILTEKDEVITDSLFCIRLSYSISEEKLNFCINFFLGMHL